MLSEDVLDRIFESGPQLTVVNVFGLTEAGRACSRSIRRGDPVSRSIGWPAPGVEICTDSAPGTPGELVIRGPNVMLGYLDDVTPESGIRYDPCREVRTGDIGYVGDGGEVFLLGRRDHLMNLKGVKVHPAEIEVVALKTRGVDDARAYLNGVLYIDVVSRLAGEDVIPAVKAALRAALPGYCQPSEVRLVDHIPRTDQGSKTLR
jgi:acyl-CoA synthetase (AMP-forming)/AMP-acid ligase II